ncbi:hypothetical protein OAI38_02050 [Flavobacteriaceae bacterium]|nr:hypothetical protein [Flavobacteriaceae bacterium]MDB4147846.1 hypothetical protein [bacterium]MDB4087200.1 hypothetical protein [Flavobacteriaceae bacterium]MDB4131763.1 hypothetical protein [Flavobacteriaceae bacterium]MDB4239852.1 hypothetical protein [Flavobacteriaceae bacterium]
MKKLLLLSLIGLFISCASQNQECETPSNGFIEGTGQSVTLGSEASIDVFKAIDKAWTDRDYETLKTLISNDGNFTHDDNTVSTNAEEFIAHIEAGYQTSLESGEEWGWVTNFAFSVKPTKSEDGDYANENGEWVCARFTGSNGDVYEEWYQIVDGQLAMWSSAKRENK